jgi:DNA (cytosine-5)-methyltransferase 1
MDIPAVLPFDTTQITSPQNGNNPHYGDPCHPLAAGAHAPAIAIDCRNHRVNDVSGTLQAKENGGQSLNYINPVFTFQNTGIGWWNESDIAECLRTPCGGDSTKANLALQNAVRRLTPLECARLQGYPDNWHILPKISDMPDTDYEFFAQVYREHQSVIKGKPIEQIKKPSKKSMIKWYNGLDSDSAVYKAYGNSLAIPCAYFVIRRIMDVING